MKTLTEAQLDEIKQKPRWFKDTKGRPWKSEITIATVRRVLEHEGVDLMAVAKDDTPTEEQLFFRLQDDPILLCSVLYRICQPQLERANVSPEDFGESLAGDVIVEAISAVLYGLADFFPRRQRNRMYRMILAAEELTEAIHNEQDAKLSLALTKKNLEKAAQSILGGKSTDAPESSDSTTNRSEN